MFKNRPTSKYRHMFGKAHKPEHCYNGVRTSKNTWEANFCHVNPKFLAVITEAGAGASFMVLPIEKTGRLDINQPLVGGHTGAVLDIKWNPFDDNVIASASEDCTARVWYIPDGGITENLDQPLLTLRGHQRKVTHVLWHPVAENILLTAAQDKMIYIWDLTRPDSPVLEFSFPDIILCVDFDYQGSKIVATFKDKYCRVIDLRKGEMLHEWSPHTGTKPSQCVYLKDGRVFTTGFEKMSERRFALWDLNKLDEPLDQLELDTSNGVLFPFYDSDIDVIYLSGKGDSTIRYFEQQDTSIFYLECMTSKDGARGLAFMPKRGLDFTKNEIAKVFKLHALKGYCEVISFTVPRVADNFQDDLYPDTRAPRPALTAAEWLIGGNKDPELMSIKELFEAQSAPVTTTSTGQALKDRLTSQIASSLGGSNDRRPTGGAPQDRRPSSGPQERRPSASDAPPQSALTRRGSGRGDTRDDINTAARSSVGGMVTTEADAINGSSPSVSHGVGMSSADLDKLLAPLRDDIKLLKNDQKTLKNQNDKLATEADNAKKESEKMKTDSAAQGELIKKLRQKVKVLEAKVSLLEASKGEIKLDDSDDDDALV